MAGKYDKNIKITVDDKGSLKQKTKDVNKLNKAVDKNNKKSGNLDRNMKGNARMSANASKNFSKQAQGMQGVLVPAYAELAARVFAVTAAFTAMSEAANYSILLKGQEAYASQTGKSLSGISKVIQRASKHMLSYKEAATSAALATTSGLTTKQIEKMTEAALGASVALGRNMSDSMDRLTRGIVKAEPEILDELGIIIRLDNVYKEYADTLGVATASLSEHEKMQARTVAILGQAEDKYGDIGDAIEGNQFEVFGAAVLDIARNAGVMLSSVFSPIAKFLGDSTVLLAALMAVISRSVLSKALPALKGLGNSIKQVPKDLEKVTKKFEGWTKNLQSKVASKKLKLINIQKLEDEFKKTIKTFSKSSPRVAEAMAKGFKGKKFINAISRAMRASIGHATARIKAGDMNFGGMLKGQDTAGVGKVNTQFNELVSATKDLGKQMGGLRALSIAEWVTGLGGAAARAGTGFASAASNVVMFNAALYSTTSIKGFTAGLSELGKALQVDFKHMAGFRFSINNLKKAFKGVKLPLADTTGQLSMFEKVTLASTFSLKKLWAGTKITAKAITGLGTVALSGALDKLNMFVGVISAISMAGWALDWLGIGTAINEAKDSLDGFSSSLEELARDAAVVPELGASFQDLRKSIDIEFNLASRLETELKGISHIDINGALEGFFNTIYSSIASLISFGIGESVADSLVASLAASQALDQPIGDKTLDSLSQIGLSDSVFDKISKGIKLNKDELESIQDDVDDYIGTLGFFVGTDSTFVQNIQKGLLGTASATKASIEESKRAFDAASEAGTSFFKEQRDLGRSLVENTPFTKYADSYENLLTRLDKLSDSAKISYLRDAKLLEKVPTQGVVHEQDLSSYKHKSKEVKKSLKAMRAAQKKGDVEEKDRLDKKIKELKASLENLGANMAKDLTTKYGSTSATLEAMLGFNPSEMEEEFRTLKTSTEDFKRSKDKLQKLGVSTTSEVMISAEENILNLKIKQLQNVRTILSLNKEKNKDQLANTDRELLLEKDKLKALRRNTQAVAEYNSEATGGVITLSQKWDNIFKDFGPVSSSKELEQFGALVEQRAHDISAAYSEVLKSMDPLTKENEGLANWTAIVNEKFKGQEDVIEGLIGKWERLNTEFGKFNTKLQASVLASQAAVNLSGAALSSARSEVSSPASGRTIELEKHLTTLRTTQANSLDKMKADMKAQEKSSKYISQFVISQEKANKKMLANAKLSFLLTRKATKLDSIKDRIKVIKAEKDTLEYERDNLNMLPELLDQRERIVELERQYAQEGLDFELQKLKIMEKQLTLSNLRNAHSKESKEKEFRDFAPYRDAIAAFGSGVTPSISQAVSDYIQGIENEVSPRQVAQQAVADSIGGWAGDMVNEQLTGRGGMVAGLFEKFGSSDLADNLFGKDPDEVFNKLTQAISDLTDSININNNRLKTSLEAQGWKFGKGVSPKVVEQAGNIQNQIQNNKSGMPDSATMLKDLKAQGYLISPSASQKTLEQAWKNAFPDKKKQDAVNDAMLNPGSAYVHDTHSEKVLNRIADALINGSGKPGTNLAYSEGGFFSDAEGTPMEIMERVSKQRYKKTGKTTLPYTGMFGGHRKSQYYDMQLENEGRKTNPQPDQLPQNYIDHYIKEGYLPEGSKSGQPVEHDLDKIYEKFNIAKNDPLAGKVYLQVASAGDMPDWQKKIWDKAIKDGVEQSKKVLNDVKIQKSQGTKGLQNYPYNDHRSTRDANSLREMFKNQGGEIKGTQKSLPYFQHPDSYRKFNMSYQEPASTPGIQNFIRTMTEWLPEIKRVGASLIGLSPSKLADGTLQGNNMLGPGEIGPKTEHQTTLENLMRDINLKTPALEQQSSALDAAIKSSNGMGGANKVEVVNTDALKSESLDLNIAASAKGVAEQGVRELITSGEVNTRNLAGSFAGSLMRSATNKAVDAVMDYDWMSLFFANGGIAKGGFRAFASGGVVNKPTVGLVGEGKYNEAVVPLPDGKSIPVIGGGGGETNNNITVNVTIDSDGNAKSDAQQPGIGPEQAKQLGYMVTQAVQSELVEQKRPGGLLSSY
jgi:hypothetical protein